MGHLSRCLGDYWVQDIPREKALCRSLLTVVLSKTKGFAEHLYRAIVS
jgi:hypothetical protein